MVMHLQSDSQWDTRVRLSGGEDCQAPGFVLVPGRGLEDDDVEAPAPPPGCLRPDWRPQCLACGALALAALGLLSLFGRDRTTALDLPADLQNRTLMRSRWSPVDGAANRECRGSDASDKLFSYFKVHQFTSITYCKDLCVADPECKAVSYGADLGVCELWHQKVSSSAEGRGWMCFAFDGERDGSEEAPEPQKFEPLDGGVSKACRASHGVSDDVACSYSGDSEDKCEVHMLISLGACQEFCLRQPECTGIDYSGLEQRCELWKVALGKPADAEGSICLTRQGAGGNATAAPSGCSKLWDGCLETRCCEDPQATCYKKNDFWASCRTSCTRGEVDTTGVDTLPWSCEAIGSTERPVWKDSGDAAAKVLSFTYGKGPNEDHTVVCSKSGEDCRQKRCCSDPGHNCYSKNVTWASCLLSCDTSVKGPDDTLWSCEMLEQKGSPRTGEISQAIPVEAKRQLNRTCSPQGANCRQSRCCLDQGLKCYEKDDDWASCHESCVQGQHDTKGPDNLPWTCAQMEETTAMPVGGGSGECSKRGENCAESRCCADEKSKCYEKNFSWSGCRKTCQKNMYDPESTDWLPWTCVLRNTDMSTSTIPITTSQTQTTTITTLVGGKLAFAVVLDAVQEKLGREEMMELQRMGGLVDMMEA